MTPDSLAEFELLVMLAALRLGPEEAYTVSIVNDIEERTGRLVRRANVYTTLQRLEAKGFLSTRLGEPRPERGGRPPRLVTIEPSGLAGLATLTGEVLRTGGTEELGGDAIDEFLEGRAASIESSIGMDAGRASMSCLKEDFEEVLELFADILRRPVFDENKIAVARNQINASIARQNDDALGILFREFGKVVLGSDSPYTRPDTYTSAARITRDDIDWSAFLAAFIELGGDGFYGAYQPAHLEPVFANLNRAVDEDPERYPHFAGRLPRYERGTCPAWEKLQPRIIMLKTNYFDTAEADRQAEILAQTLARF